MQEYNLDKSITPENTTAESMDNIIKAGEDLLKQTVKAIDINSFTPHKKNQVRVQMLRLLIGLCTLLTFLYALYSYSDTPV
jgi:hypothetical protein